MLPASYATPAAAVLAIAGLLACFAGYRLFRIVLGIFGFIIGAMVTTGVLGQASQLTYVAAALVGGIVGSLLMVAAYFVGVGLVGAGLAALALNLAWRPFHSDPPTVLLVIVCVLGALGALSVVRYVVVIGTSLGGAWTAIFGGLALMGNDAARHAVSGNSGWIMYPLDPMPNFWWIVPAWLVLSALGMAIQLSTTKKSGATRAAKKAKIQK